MNKLSLQKIKDYISNNSLLTPKKLTAVAQEIAKNKTTFEEAVTALGFLNSRQFNEIKAKTFNIEPSEIGDVEINLDVLNFLSFKVAKNYQMIVFAKEGNKIKVGMVNPGDFKAHEAIEFLAGQQGVDPVYYSISLEDFRGATKWYSGFKKEIGSALELAEEKFATKMEETSAPVSDEELEKEVKTAPVAKIVSVIIRHAVEGGASDIHIEPDRKDSRVRFRIDGSLHQSLSLPLHVHNSVVSRIKVMASLKLDETRIPQDGRIRETVDGQPIDLRVSILPTLNAEKVVMRVLDTSAGIPTLSELGFLEHHRTVIEKHITSPNGLFLITGPTGSGKTTTLYSILNSINGESQNVITLEDPIEYYLTGINQSQIRADLDYTFAKGLRAILRQDPNVIMVGEVRDTETAELVIHSALTGHLVFSTLHTNNAWGAIPRLMDMKVEPFLLSATLNMVMAQRLVRKICPSCKAESKLPADLKAKMDKHIAGVPPEFLSEFGGDYKFYTGKGCDECGQTGYVGRVAIAEVLESNSEIKNIISTHAGPDAVQAVLKKQNFVNLIQDGIIKALKGITSIEEVMRATKD